MSPQERIQQFKNMADADPENELCHFSLAKAYLDAERSADAADSFERVLQLNPGYSRAYHLKAEAQLKTEQRAEAIATLRKGVAVAAARGDLMPRNAMGELLRSLGEFVPELEVAREAPRSETGDGSFLCGRCHRSGGKLPERPFKGEIGERIGATICADCWREWIGMGTKVINELGLQLSDPRAQEVYDQHMKEFLMLEA
ncbi:MAG: tetratricopeptide repeat protein [bacterium]|nr:tetratricopeptide repeat protein [bacterium]